MTVISRLISLSFSPLATRGGSPDWRRAWAPLTRQLLAASGVALGLGWGGVPAAAEATRDTFGTGTNEFSIEFVAIGHTGNVDDETSAPYPLGGVSYRYRIGKYEISEDLIQKANAAGALGITTTTLGPNKPAGSLSFYEAARFVNWLNTSSGYLPAYNFNAKGEWLPWSSDQAWTLGGVNLYRHKEAFYFVPSADEWYKAAHFDGTNYFRYATGSDGTPVAVPEGTQPRTAVYGQAEEAGPADVDNAGGLSPYGTMAQGGNAAEWTESATDGVNETTDQLLQIRGGRWSAGASALRGSSSNSGRPWHAASFRVAALPPRLPMAPELTLQPAADGSGLELSFVSQEGVDYDVERAASPAGVFLTIDTLPGTGGVIRYVFKPTLEEGAYYRVVATGVDL